jgi:hypothetical protein
VLGITMFKKIYVAITFSVVSMTALATLNDLNNHLIHVQTQIKAVTKSWQKAEMTLLRARVKAPTLYPQMVATAKKLLSLEDISTKMNTLVDQQLQAMVYHNTPYRAINFLDDYFQQKTTDMKPLLHTICSAMANKEYRSLLGKKLTTKKRELNAEIAATQNQEFAPMPYNQ